MISPICTLRKKILTTDSLRWNPADSIGKSLDSFVHHRVLPLNDKHQHLRGTLLVLLDALAKGFAVAVDGFRGRVKIPEINNGITIDLHPVITPGLTECLDEAG